MAPAPESRPLTTSQAAARVLVSVLVPVYNEEEFVGVVLERVLSACLPAHVDIEIIVVDDGSTDGSAEVVAETASRHSGKIQFIRHRRNLGKGAAVRTAIQHAGGSIAIVQDADLEYDPAEYSKLLEPLLSGKADAVFGSRFHIAGERRVLYFWHALANRVLTTLCNMAADLNLSDMETCYKAFRLSLVKSIPLRSNRFGIEPELTIKLAQRQACIYELPISYYGRTYAEGKKIGLRDALGALFTIFRFGLIRDTYIDRGARILDSLADTPHFNRWMADTIAPFLGATVLEIGAGIGNLTKHLSSRKGLYFATDVSEEHLTRLRTRFQHRPAFRIQSCNVEDPVDFAILHEQVDSVVCLNVLEHVLDDTCALRNIWSALRPRGRAVILVPEGMSIFGTLDQVLGHHRRYSEEELRSKLKSCGFEIERMLRFNRITRPAWFWNGRVLNRYTFGRLQLWTFDRLVWLWRRIDPLLPWRPVSIIAVAVKPVPQGN